MKDRNAPGAFDATHAVKKKERKWKEADKRLVAALCYVIPPRSRVVDFGAGLGRYVDALLQRGYNAVGLDGIKEVYSLSGGIVIEADLTRQLTVRAEWVISFEVGEHIPPPHDSQYLDNIARCCTDGAIISWAVPGQRGKGHVNCLPPEAVVERLSLRGMLYDEKTTHVAREIAGGGWSRKLLVFRKAGKGETQ